MKDGNRLPQIGKTTIRGGRFTEPEVPMSTQFIEILARSYLYDLRLVRSQLEGYYEDGGLVHPSELNFPYKVLDRIVKEIEDGPRYI